MNDSYVFSNLIEYARNQNYNKYNEKYFNKNSSQCITKETITSMLNNYLQKIVEYKLPDREFLNEKIKTLSKHAIEHLTGNYNIGITEETFEEIDEKLENISNIIAYSNNAELNEILNDNREKELSYGVVDGCIALGTINTQEDNTRQKAIDNFNKIEEKIKTFFENAIYNIGKCIAHVSGMDKEESKELNSNILGKFVGGIGYDLLSGTLISKRHFTPVQNSQSMQKKIEEGGILHFTSPSNIEKILKSQKIKKSSFLESDLTAKKSFFFAGAPTFEDLLINIPAYDVMTAVKIMPTKEQISKLKYRVLNDRAVTNDGDFEFDNNQVQIVYYGLMYDKEKSNIYLGELTKEEASNFKVSEEVKNAYHYNAGKNSIMDNMKMNAYGLYAEYKHHQKLKQIGQKMKEKGINDYRNFDDATLVELADIEQAYIDTKEKSVERKNIFDKIKNRIELQKNKDKLEKEDKENDSEKYLY